MHPPGKILSCITAGHVLLNKLKAHCEAYEAIKRTPVGKSLMVMADMLPNDESCLY